MARKRNDSPSSSLKEELEQERRRWNKEVADFNDGWKVADIGGSLSDRPEGAGDSWEDGFKACRYEDLQAEIEELRKVSKSLSDKELKIAQESGKLRAELLDVRGQLEASEKRLKKASLDFQAMSEDRNNLRSEYDKIRRDLYDALMTQGTLLSNNQTLSNELDIARAEIERRRNAQWQSASIVNHYRCIVLRLTAAGKGKAEFADLIGESYSVASAIWDAVSQG